MRVSQIAFAAAILSTASAFTVAPRGPAGFAALSMSTVAEPEVDEETTAEEAVAEAEPVPKSGLTISGVRKSIDSLTKENFSATLGEIEPFLLNEAGVTFYKKSMRRITRNAQALGVDIPEGYALEAKATAARRTKQNEFVQLKIQEAADDAAAAAEEEAAAAAAAATTVRKSVQPPKIMVKSTSTCPTLMAMIREENQIPSCRNNSPVYIRVTVSLKSPHHSVVLLFWLLLLDDAFDR
mmetsp:Transcript_3090/g.4685  ORF Transcript_3090/g.4685 Transcript_3090/m.4685 type:complete len:239 (-) Transcript_3090:242-958(-)